ncbi:MAG: porphobilinogen synthase, partial [Flavobacteriales bacterium]
RRTAAIRDLTCETHLHAEQFIYPLFVRDGVGTPEPIVSMPGVMRWCEQELYHEIEACLQLGIRSFVLFPAVDDSLKDATASYGLRTDNFYLRMIRGIKQRFPEVCIMSDVAMDPYSSDGHDGLVVEGEIVNDLTLEILGAMAVVQADAGVDIIGPSDMMDGRVGHIRNVLDAAGFTSASIMSYTAKYASAFYGPFRDALDSAPKFGDKKTYQMNPANRREALREAYLDQSEGADFLMVKPALSYLDIISDLSSHTDVPVAAYNVSGEYAMVKASAERGWIDHDRAMLEILTSIRRAGADIILTYFAKDAARLIKSM